ncbi:MAG: glycosyltransferase family 2 protein [Gemmatimonadaceae bacterium]
MTTPVESAQLRPLITVAIPAYNRAALLTPLLDSIVSQSMTDWECLIVEDNSRERNDIRAVIEANEKRFSGRLRYIENEETLGYDGNFRQLVAQARGRYLFVMGNDDLVTPGALAAVQKAIEAEPNVGIILRAYSFFRGDSSNVFQVNRYYASACTFEAGVPAIVACYRRLVSMSGLVIHRDDAAAVATDRWDGTLFYQHWLAANILVTRPAAYIPNILALFRKDGVPEFGAAKAEQGKYTPGVQPPDTDLRMIRSLMSIAEAVERERGIAIAEAIRKDFANYMYPTIAHQAHVSRREFYKFYRDLGALGFNRYAMFHFWFWSIAIVGAERVDRVIQFVRKRLGHTPNLTRAARPTTQQRSE